ncbi:MAG: NAD(P)-dependent alcohol dehydrogenase [Bacteroidales bacterium]|nr:NAD(P)-dependent alcohol dehydrogenase [Bacteroidales bacterium]
MKAIVCTKYGLEALQLKEVKNPVPGENEVLVEVHASSVTTNNAIMVTGKPFFVRLMGKSVFKPSFTIPGTDLSGRVISVGSNVKQFKPGDEVFGDTYPCFGTCAEYIAVPESALCHKPANLSFEEAAAVPQVAVVALQGLRNHGHILKGQKVLIFGASGGIGSFAIQLAKYYGTEVTGVCSSRNVAMVRSMGADYVIDYTKEDYTRSEKKYDLIYAISYRSIFDHMRALSPRGVFVSTGGPSLSRVFQEMLMGPMISNKNGKRVATGWMAEVNRNDLAFIKDLIEAGKLKPFIDRYYPLSETAEAFRYYGQGHTRGKVVITVSGNRK